MQLNLNRTEKVKLLNSYNLFIMLSLFLTCSIFTSLFFYKVITVKSQSIKTTIGQVTKIDTLNINDNYSTNIVYYTFSIDQDKYNNFSYSSSSYTVGSSLQINYITQYPSFSKLPESVFLKNSHYITIFLFLILPPILLLFSIFKGVLKFFKTLNILKEFVVTEANFKSRTEHDYDSENGTVTFKITFTYKIENNQYEHYILVDEDKYFLNSEPILSAQKNPAKSILLKELPSRVRQRINHIKGLLP